MVQLLTINQRAKKLGYESYGDYLKSDHWRGIKYRYFNETKTIKKMKIKHGGLVCMKCECRQELNVHHMSYKRMGKEHLGDLKLLCQPCHKELHKLHRDKYWKVGLWKASHVYLNKKYKVKHSQCN